MQEPGSHIKIYVTFLITSSLNQFNLFNRAIYTGNLEFRI